MIFGATILCLGAIIGLAIGCLFWDRAFESITLENESLRKDNANLRHIIRQNQAEADPADYWKH